MFAILFAIFGLKSQNFIVISHNFSVKMPKIAFLGKKLPKMDCSVRYFPQKLDYRSLFFQKFGLDPKIVRY